MKKLIYGLLALGVFFPLQGQNLKTIKKELQQSIDEKKDQLTQVSDSIWEAAETSLEEFITWTTPALLNWKVLSCEPYSSAFWAIKPTLETLPIKAGLNAPFFLQNSIVAL